MKLSKTYDHPLNEHTQSWARQIHSYPIDPRITALDDAVIFLCASCGVSDNERSQARLALGQALQRDRIAMTEWNQISERMPSIIRYVATYKSLSLRSTLDIIRAGDLRFADIEGALTTPAIKYEIEDFKDSKFYLRIIEREKLSNALSGFNKAISKDAERIVTSKYFNHVLVASLILFIGAIAWEVAS